VVNKKRKGKEGTGGRAFPLWRPEKKERKKKKREKKESRLRPQDLKKPVQSAVLQACAAIGYAGAASKEKKGTGGEEAQWLDGQRVHWSRWPLRPVALLIMMCEGCGKKGGEKEKGEKERREKKKREGGK